MEVISTTPAGMLKRSKYSRLRSDSVASLEDCPKRILSLKEDLCIDTDFALLGPGTPTHHGTSTVRNFIPRVANIRLQSPVSLHGLGGRTVADGHGDRPLSCTGWDLRPNERLCSRPFAGEPLSTHCALSCTKRPITLHRMAGLTQTHRCAPCMQHRDDVCCLKASHAAAEQMANRVVHHDIKVPVITRSPPNTLCCAQNTIFFVPRSAESCSQEASCPHQSHFHIFSLKLLMCY